MLLSPDPIVHQLVSDSMGRCHIEIVLGCNMAVFDKGMVKVPVETLLYSAHVFQLRDVSH